MLEGEVSYVTDGPAEYIKAVAAVESAAQLRSLLRAWEWAAPDALAAAPSQDEWDEFKRGLRSERRKQFAGEAWAERFGAILLPERMMRVSRVAAEFGVPWGLAYRRMQEAGSLDAD